MIPIHTMHEWSFCSTIICNIYFWHTGNGRLWEPNQSLDGSDNLSSQKDEGATRQILFSFWHSRMHQRLFLVIFLAFSREMVFCFKNCSDRPWEKIGSFNRELFLKSKAEGREFAKKFRSLFRTIYSNSERSVHTIFKTECFFNLFLEVFH